MCPDHFFLKKKNPMHLKKIPNIIDKKYVISVHGRDKNSSFYLNRIVQFIIVNICMYLGIYQIPTYIFNPIWADTISDKIPQKK